MKLTIAALTLLVAFAVSSCSRCRTMSDCDMGERCDFDTGDCILGCTSNAECASTARCNLELGRCEPINRPPLFPEEDASSEDVATSTPTDAAPGD